MRRLPSIALATAALAASAAGCGTDEPDRELSARATLREAQTAFAAKDVDRLCELLSQHAKVVIGHAGHGTRPVDCHGDVRHYMKWFKPYPGGKRPALARVSKTSEDRATLFVDVPGGGEVAVAARIEDGAWKLDFFDAVLSRIQLRGQPGEARLKPPATLPPPLPAANGIRARDVDTGRPCPPVRVRRFPALAGGCVLATNKRKLSLSLETAFGVMPFARCGISFRVRVDSRGRAWIANFGIDGGSPCFDVMQCWDNENAKVPWQATVRRRAANDGYQLDIDNVCLDTCLGRFTGRWSFDLDKGQRGWRLRANSMVDRTGWRIDGPLESPRRAFTIDG